MPKAALHAQNLIFKRRLIFLDHSFVIIDFKR